MGSSKSKPVEIDDDDEAIKKVRDIDLKKYDK